MHRDKQQEESSERHIIGNRSHCEKQVALQLISFILKANTAKEFKLLPTVWKVWCPSGVSGFTLIMES